MFTFMCWESGALAPHLLRTAFGGNLTRTMHNAVIEFIAVEMGQMTTRWRKRGLEKRHRRRSKQSEQVQH